MLFKKFVIFTKNPSSQMEEEIEMVLNLAHIVSVKPIRMTTEDRRVIKGYWLRLSNGKKYKATSIPKELLMALDEKMNPIMFETETNEVSIQ